MISRKLAPVVFMSVAALSFVGQTALLRLAPPSLASRQIAEQGADRSLEFRDLFLGSLEKPLDDESMKKLIFLPTAPLTKITHQAESAEKLMAILNDVQKGIDPLALYEAGRATPANPVASDQADSTLMSAGARAEDRLTIVIVPGIFGEFIKTRAFEEIFAEKSSAYRDLFAQRLAAYRGDPADLKDKTFSMSDVAEIERPIEQLMHVSSIDKDGMPLVNVVLFDTTLLSLESLGPIADRAEIFNRRLGKFLRIMESPEAGGAPHSKLAFLGYSRGTMIGLEMLARANEKTDQNPWIARTKAMISLGGVVYGSDLADDAVNAKGGAPSAAYRQLALLSQLNNSLQTADSPAQWAKVVSANTVAWTKFMKGMIDLTLAPDGLWGIVKFFKPGYVKGRMKEVIAQFERMKNVDVRSGIGLATSFAFKTFALEHPGTQYNANVRRFKMLASAVVNAVPELSTAARLDWWKKNIVPSHLKYYAIAGTMIDDVGTGFQHELATNNLGFNFQLVDDGSLMQNYRDFRAVAGISANDSQVAIYKVRFWNELNQLLNPAQPKLDVNFLGVVGTHHWGLALRVVNEADPSKVTNIYNPFPRRVLMRSLGAQVIKDLAN